jgi:hypothetical protein
MLKLGHFGKYIQYTLKVLKFGAGEGWRRSVGSIVWEMECYIEARKRGISYMK